MTAKALQQDPRFISMPAGSDLSAKQYHFMTITSQKLAAAGDGVRVLGVLDNDPDAADKPGTVQYGGVALVLSGASGSAGAVSSDSAGKCVNTAAGEEVAGYALKDFGSGEYVPVLLTPSASIVIGGYLDTALDTDALEEAHLKNAVYFSIADTKEDALPDGTVVGHILELHCDAVSGTPAGTVTGTFLSQAGAAGTDLAYNAAGDYARLVWTGAAWRVLALNSVTLS